MSRSEHLDSHLKLRKAGSSTMIATVFTLNLDTRPVRILDDSNHFALAWSSTLLYPFLNSATFLVEPRDVPS